MTIRSFLGSPSGLVVCLLVSAVGAWLLWTHTGHVLAALPFLVLLACPLVQVWHRGSHSHERRKVSGLPTDREPPQ